MLDEHAQKGWAALDPEWVASEREGRGGDLRQNRGLPFLKAQARTTFPPRHALEQISRLRKSFKD